MKEQGSRDYEPMHRHLSSCTHFNDLMSIMTIDGVSVNNKQHILNNVLNNCEIIKRYQHWSHLCFMEAYYIKYHKPTINCGIRASKELALFK